MDETAFSVHPAAMPNARHLITALALCAALVPAGSAAAATGAGRSGVGDAWGPVQIGAAGARLDLGSAWGPVAVGARTHHQAASHSKHARHHRSHH